MSEPLFELPDDGEKLLITEEKLKRLKDSTFDCVLNLLYYDRKEDEDLSVEDIKELLQLKAPRQDIIDTFISALDEHIGELE